MSKRLAIDLDNTLTVSNNRWWEREDEPEPDEEVIGFVRQAYAAGHTVMVHTARPNLSQDERGIIDVRSRTEQWLRENRVPYHALVMDKLSADVYIDDKSVHPDDIDEVEI